MENPTYRFPLCRFFTISAVFFLADMVCSTLLWLIHESGTEIKQSVTDFHVESSVFDLFILNIGRCLLLLLTFKMLESMTISAAQNGANNRIGRILMKLLTLITLLGSIAYIVCKGVVVLKKYDKNEHVMNNVHYTLCISSFSFAVIEFVLFLCYLYHLNRLRNQYYVSMSTDVDMGGSKKEEKKKIDLRRLLTLIGPVSTFLIASIFLHDWFHFIQKSLLRIALEYI